MNKKVVKICKAWVERAQMAATPGEEIYIIKINEERLKRTSTSSQMAVKALPKGEKTWDQIVPLQYHKWKVISEKEAKRYPKHQLWDIPIDFTKEAPKILDLKIYPLSLGEQEKLDKYIKKNLKKGYICPLKSQYSSLFFFMGKKDGKLWPVVDYRKPNSFTISDLYPLLLIQELVDKVWNARLFTKMDVRAGYNNIRFRKEDVAKAAFETNQEL